LIENNFNKVMDLIQELLHEKEESGLIKQAIVQTAKDCGMDFDEFNDDI
jgi:hypothetical protein